MHISCPLTFQNNYLLNRSFTLWSSPVLAEKENLDRIQRAEFARSGSKLVIFPISLIHLEQIRNNRWWIYSFPYSFPFIWPTHSFSYYLFPPRFNTNITSEFTEFKLFQRYMYAKKTSCYTNVTSYILNLKIIIASGSCLVSKYELSEISVLIIDSLIRCIFSYKFLMSENRSSHDWDF